MNFSIKFLINILLIWLLATSISNANSNSGDYLSAIHADRNNDFLSASKFYSRSLKNDPSNVMLLRGAIRSNIYFGNFSDAIYYSEKLNKFEKVEEYGTITSLLTLTNKIKNAEYNQAKKLLHQPNKFNLFLTAMLTGWLENGSENI